MKRGVIDSTRFKVSRLRGGGVKIGDGGAARRRPAESSRGPGEATTT